VQTCVDGDLIGEFCVLLGEQCPVRTSSAQAVSYCDLYVLEQDALALLLSYYPAVQAQLESRTAKRRNMVLKKEENIIGLVSPSAASAANNGNNSSGGVGGRLREGSSSSRDTRASSIAGGAKKSDKMKQLLGETSLSPPTQQGAGAAAGHSQQQLHTASGRPIDPSSLQYKVLLWLRMYWLTTTPFYDHWCRLIFAVSLYNALVVPYRLSFDFSVATPWLLVLDYCTDTLLIVHFIAHFFLRTPPRLAGAGPGTGSSSRSATVISSTFSSNSVGSGGMGGAGGGIPGISAHFETFGEARRRYLRSGWLLWDLLTCFPLDLLMLVQMEMNPWFRLPKLARFFTDARVLGSEKLQNAGLTGSTISLCQLLTGSLMTTHFTSCLYQSFAYSIGYGGKDEWLPSEEWAAEGRVAAYCWAQFQSLVLLTGLGMKAAPQGDLELLYTLFMILLGILIVAWAVGEIGELIANGDRFASEFGRQLLATSAFMHHRSFDMKVQARVRGFLAHSWSTRHGADPHVAMSGLPDGLRAEIMSYLCEHVLRRVPLFVRLMDSEPSFGRHLVERLRFSSYPAGEIIFNEGEIGDAMYFLTEGAVAVIVPPLLVHTKTAQRKQQLSSGGWSATQTLAAGSSFHARTAPAKLLGPGSFFGEVSLLTNGLRTATIRALKPTFLLVLPKEAFYSIMGAHADFKACITALAAERAARLPYLRARGEAAARVQRMRARARRKANRRRHSHSENGSPSSSSSSDADADGSHSSDANEDEEASDAFHRFVRLAGVDDAAGAAAGAAMGTNAVDDDADASDDEPDISRSQGELHVHGRGHQQAYARFLQQQQEEEDRQGEEEAQAGIQARSACGDMASPSDEAVLTPQEQHRQSQITKAAREAAAAAALARTQLMAVGVEGDSDDEDAATLLRQARDAHAESNAEVLRVAAAEAVEEAKSDGGEATSARPALRLLRIPSLPAAGPVRALQDGGLDVQLPSAGEGEGDGGDIVSAAPLSAGIETPSAAQLSSRDILRTLVRQNTLSLLDTAGAEDDLLAAPPLQGLVRRGNNTASSSSRGDGICGGDGAAETLSPRSAVIMRAVSETLGSRGGMHSIPSSAASSSHRAPFATGFNQVSNPASPAWPGPEAHAQDGGTNRSKPPQTPLFARTASGLSRTPPPPAIPLSSVSGRTGDGMGTSAAAQFFARQGGGAGGALPVLVRQGSASALLSSASAAAGVSIGGSSNALARGVSTYQQHQMPADVMGSGSDLPDFFPDLTRMRTLERRTHSYASDAGVGAAAVAGQPMSVFAQARLLHASRTIETAVRNGVLRNEAQVADVVQAVEAQLEQTEHQRQEAAAARNALNDSAAAAAALAAANSERSRSRMKHSPNLTALPATARLSPSNGPASSRLSPNQKPVGFPLDAMRAQPHGRSNSTSAARTEAAPGVTASSSAASAAAPTPLSMGAHLTTPSHPHPSRRLDSPSLATVTPGDGASPSLSVGMHADLLADRADSCESPAMRSRTWARTSDAFPVASTSLSPVAHVARPLFTPAPPLATAPTAAAAGHNAQSPRRRVVRIQIHRPTNSHGSNNSNANNATGNDRARQKWQAPPANEATATQPQSPV
jgi:CRP-like cAMP-binding protein